MKTAVLDASALLAMFFGEPGMEPMRQLFHKASEADRPVFISAVNWAEVLYKVERKQGKNGLDKAQVEKPIVNSPLDHRQVVPAAVEEHESINVPSEEIRCLHVVGFVEGVLH